MGIGIPVGLYGVADAGFVAEGVDDAVSVMDTVTGGDAFDGAFGAAGGGGGAESVCAAGLGTSAGLSVYPAYSYVEGMYADHGCC